MKNKRKFIIFEVSQEEHKRIHKLAALEDRAVKQLFMRLFKARYGTNKKEGAI
jgi:hypothetical protein